MIPLKFKWFDDSTRIHLPSSLTCHHRCHQLSSPSAKQMLPQLAFTVDTAAVHVYLKVRKWSCCKPLLQFSDGWVWLPWRSAKVDSERLWTSRSGNKHIVYVGQSALHRKFSEALQFAQQVAHNPVQQSTFNKWQWLQLDLSFYLRRPCCLNFLFVATRPPCPAQDHLPVQTTQHLNCNQPLSTTLSSG